MKLEWPPLGYQDETYHLKTVREDNEHESERIMRRYQRISYQKKISTPICLTFDKINLTDNSSHAIVSGI